VGIARALARPARRRPEGADHEPAPAWFGATVCDHTVGEFGTSTDVEISAVAVPHAEEPCLGFTIRNVGRRLMADSRAGRELPRSWSNSPNWWPGFAEGSGARIHRSHRAAVHRGSPRAHGDNRASAAEMLGLSRQSLYVKLRRYGLGDLTSEEES